MPRSDRTARPRSHRLTPLAGAIAAFFSLPGPAFAGPTGGQVVGGQATISQSGTHTQVNQQTSQAIIDWRSFNVGSQESVQFNQPSSQAAILNRVIGNDPSAIFGRITANGQVFLVNPNGVLFGRSAQVDVGGLMATTANISNADFMAGRLDFKEPGKPGATVRNEGSIRVAEGGFVGLVGPGVENAGVISARLGKVTLAAGEAFVLDLYGDRLVNFVLDPALMPALTDAHGQPLSASVNQSGQIIAPGGRVVLTVDTVKRLIDNVINVSGDIKATSFDTSPGVISLLGNSTTTVRVDGRLDAVGQAAQGGRIEVTGREVTLGAASHLDASGDSGGGSVAVGGDWQGQGTLANATRVEVRSGAQIDVSAGQHGQGGTAVVWSDGTTQFDGQILARGGQTGGDGGQVEVSGKQHLRFEGDVDASAHHGRAGNLLLDPHDLTISEAGATNLPGPSDSGDSTVAASTVNRILAGGTTVNLQADRDIAVNAVVDGRTSAGGRSGGGLNLTAGRDIAFNAYVLLNDGALQAQAGGQITSATGTYLYTGAGPIDLRGAAGIDVDRVLTQGAVNLASSAGSVTVRNPLLSLGNPATPIASLNVDAQQAVSLGGVLSNGDVAIRSRTSDVTAGPLLSQASVLVEAGRHAGTTDAPLNLMGRAGAQISGQQGVRVNVAQSDGVIRVRSGQGDVSIAAPVTGAYAQGELTDASPVAQGLNIEAAGAVQISGGTVGPTGLNVAGAHAGQGAGSFTLSQGSLLSTGPIAVSAQGPIVLEGHAGIRSAGAVDLASQGQLTINEGGVEVTRDGAYISLAGGAGVTLNGSIGFRTPERDPATGQFLYDPAGANPSASIRISSDNGAIVQRVSSDAALNSLVNAGRSADRAHVTMAGNAIQAGDIIAQGTVSLSTHASASGTPSGDVILQRPLGGPSTGYMNFADGYQERLKPNVGRLLINSGRSVLLSGLNLDGNADPYSTALGLSITAQNRIVVPDQVAVNKGGIAVGTTGDGETDGVYLGNNLYSRGYDRVNVAGSRTQESLGDYEKVAYSITLSGRNLVLFDNTDEIAYVPTGDWYNPNAIGSPGQDDYTPELTIHPGATNEAGIFGFVPADESVFSQIAQSVTKPIAKIIIGNNVANYADEAFKSQLVPSNSAQTQTAISIDSESLSAVDIPRSSMDLSNGQVLLRPLSQAKISPDGLDYSGTHPSCAAPTSNCFSAQTSPPTGIALKLIVDSAPSDRSTALAPSSGFARVTGESTLALSLSDRPISSAELNAGFMEREIRSESGETFLVRYSISTQEWTSGRENRGHYTVASIRNSRSESVDSFSFTSDSDNILLSLGDRGEVRLFGPYQFSDSAGGGSASIQVNSVFSSSQSTSPALSNYEAPSHSSYVLTGSYIVNQAGRERPASYAILYDGVLQNGGGMTTLSAEIVSTLQSPTSFGTPPGNTTTWISPGGAFDQLGSFTQAGTTRVDGVSNSGIFSGMIPPPSAPYPDQTQAVAGIERYAASASRDEADAGSSEIGSDEDLVSVTPFAQADLGRSTASAGANADVFRKRYRVAYRVGQDCTESTDFKCR